MIVCFVDIGRIYDHYRLNFLFIVTRKVHIIIYLTFIIFFVVLLYYSFLNMHNIYGVSSL